MAATKDLTVFEVTDTYLGSLDMNNLPPPDDLKSELLERTCQAFELENQVRPKGSKWKIPDALFPAQISMILLTLYHIKRIAMAGLGQDPEYDVLTVYMSDGEDAGTYVSDVYAFHRLIRQYNWLISSKMIDEVMDSLRCHASRVEKNSDPDLIAVNNGIFNYKTKSLLPFSPDMVFTSKSHVDYNTNAANVSIHNPEDNTDWDIESWIHDLSDDPEVEDLFWKIIGAVLRPNVRWDKAVWFYSEKGSNGKGTFCALLRNMLGQHAYASISLSDFAKDFMLEPLVKANAIIVDENDVGEFIDKAANLKAVVTGDVIQINRKFKSAIAYQFHGLMVQCLNGMPRVKDKSESFARRLLFVPFDKSFTGKERKYIKSDYLARREVLEYVMLKVLNMPDYDKLPEPAVCLQTLEEYKSQNNPVVQFVEDILPQCSWDLLPYRFLYDLYVSWYSKYVKSGTTLGKATFVKELNQVLEQNAEWAVSPGGSAHRPQGRMDWPELLIAEYGLKDWTNKSYTGGDVLQMCMPVLHDSYRGVLRRLPAGRPPDGVSKMND